jgi:NADH-quinone oxidoreductase subunit M
MFLGKLNKAYVGYPDLVWRERLTLYPLAAIAVFLGFYPQYILLMVNGSLHELIKNIRPL